MGPADVGFASLAAAPGDYLELSLLERNWASNADYYEVSLEQPELRDRADETLPLAFHALGHRAGQEEGGLAGAPALESLYRYHVHPSKLKKEGANSPRNDRDDGSLPPDSHLFIYLSPSAPLAIPLTQLSFPPKRSPWRGRACMWESTLV